MEQVRRFYRSRYDSVFGGVAGGLGKYFNIDPVLFRILFVALVFAGGGGLLVYIILWIAVPLDPNYQYFKYNDPTTGTATGEAQPGDNPENAEKQEYQKSEQESAAYRAEDYPSRRAEGNLIAGIVLIALGGVFLFANLMPRFSFMDLLPVILIVAGVVIMISSYSQSKRYF